MFGFSAIEIRRHVNRIYLLQPECKSAAEYNPCQHLVLVLVVVSVRLHLEERRKRVRCRQRQEQRIAYKDSQRRKEEPSVGVERLSERIGY